MHLLLKVMYCAYVLNGDCSVLSVGEVQNLKIQSLTAFYS